MFKEHSRIMIIFGLKIIISCWLLMMSLAFCLKYERFYFMEGAFLDAFLEPWCFQKLPKYFTLGTQVVILLCSDWLCSDCSECSDTSYVLTGQWPQTLIKPPCFPVDPPQNSRDRNALKSIKKHLHFRLRNFPLSRKVWHQLLNPSLAKPNQT